MCCLGQPPQVPSLFGSFVLSLCYHSINLALLQKQKQKQKHERKKKRKKKNVLPNFQTPGYFLGFF